MGKTTCIQLFQTTHNGTQVMNLNERGVEAPNAV